ncbi:MAG: NADH-quinone oxidoreductase subunit NuoE [Candidatus Omnitrophica bacterium]|nr:NADH-quinone oxidoreductase subunit NuoE [Candidatus Omnitrophota bacterium]MBU4478582.1 NADH-quinone oxidoreductase subunit NuoE [Candidatus Omnitrophota bacterium]
MGKICAVSKTIVKEGKRITVCDETRARLLPVLHEVQGKKGYISDTDMQNIANELGIHPVEVYSVVTFYSFFNLEKKGRHIIRISNCISNIMAGSKNVQREFEKALGIKSGQTTEDGKFTLEAISCIGMCDQAPAIMVDDKLIGKVTSKKVKKILEELS